MLLNLVALLHSDVLSLDSYSIQAYIHLTLSELIYMVYGFDSSSIGHFPAMVCSTSAEGSLNLVAHWI